MGLCIGYESALRYWLTKRGDEALPEPAPTIALADASASARNVARENLPLEPSRSHQLHLMVPDRSRGHTMSEVVAHVWSRALPSGSLRRLSGDNTIASPELTLVQLASQRSLVETIELADYLCSGFSIDETSRYVDERAPLTSREELAAYVDSLPPRTYGARRARQALRYTVENTASPKEILLALVYGLPPELGGEGPLVISANQPITIDEHLQRLLDSRYLKGDLYLPELNADLEYDSYEFHTGRYRLDHTQARRNALEAMGTKTISATFGQIRTFEKFEDFTWMLRERLKIGHPERTREERAAQMDLYATLMSADRRLF